MGAKMRWLLVLVLMMVVGCASDDATDGPELQRYQLQLTGTVALPTYAIVDSEGRLLSRWQGMASVEEFAAFLADAVPSQIAQRR